MAFSAKPITKTWIDPESFTNVQDDSSFLVESDDGIFPKPFVFPKKLSKLSDNEKQELFDKYQQHVQTSNGSFYTSKVISSEEAAKIKEQKALQKQENYEYETNMINSEITFDPEKGYNVPPDEYPSVLSKFDMTEEEKAKILAPKPKIVTEQQAENVRIDNLPPMEREVEQRFGNIIL